MSLFNETIKTIIRMIKAERLDVTQIVPKIKHSTIFEHFYALDGGEGFIIDNDHDPKPL